MKKILICLALIFSALMVIDVGKVSAYKCVYSGQKMDTSNWLAKADGELTINIKSATSVRADFSKFESKDNEWLDFIYSLGFAFSPTPVTSKTLLSTMRGNLDDEALDDIAMIKKNTSKEYSTAYLTNYSEQIANAFNKKKCPSTVNITYLTCDGSGLIVYNFNPDIWDWFKYEDNTYRFYINDTINGNDTPYCSYSSKDGTNTTVWQLDTKKSEKASISLMFVCKKLGNYLNETKNSLKTLYTKYQNCVSKNSDNKVKCQKHKTLYENQLLVVRNWCKSVLNDREYNSTCLQGCLDLNKKVYDIKCVRGSGKNKKDICTNNGGNCNLSEEIIAFVYNILKWMKYIAPVLVIMLGILDFIKALASQDDDAMKKAQGRFIKRLVVATILFLLPLIIDYILNVFDFYDSSCDVTELFK